MEACWDEATLIPETQTLAPMDLILPENRQGKTSNPPSRSYMNLKQYLQLFLIVARPLSPREAACLLKRNTPAAKKLVKPFRWSSPGERFLP
eukprot:scaffold5169_cov172-Amphora_coffeaeformis.AAC.24